MSLINGTIIIEVLFPAPVNTVWQAITDPSVMKQWYFELPEFKADVGFEFHFVGETDGRQYLHHCRVTEAIPPKKISYTWRFEGLSGDSLVTFELRAAGNSTALKFSHAGIDTFPNDNPDITPERFEEGWTHIIGTSLKQFLSSQQKS